MAEAKSFLKGDSRAIQQALSAEMEEAAEALDFERAAAIRDRIHALTYVQGSQDINAATIEEADIFAIHCEGDQACIQVFFYRAGQNWGNHAYFPKHHRDDAPPDILQAFMAQFYDAREAARLILVNVAPSRTELLEEALSLKSERKITIVSPKRGGKKAILDSASRNAREALARRMAETASHRRSLDALAERLGLRAPPERIEVYDNSHISGANAVGAMIVAGPEGFMKNQYRKFNIKSETLAPGDDFGMMREVLSRRLTRLMAEENDAARPDLIILDGGKGQLSVVVEIMEEVGIDPASDAITVIGVAKGRRETEDGARRVDRTMSATGEQIVMTGREPFTLAPRDPALFFLQRLRDEAHRYAISAHRAKRRKAVGANPLDEIKGVGAARKRALLHHFGSAKAIARAKPADLQAVDGVSAALAERIHDFFNGG